MRFIRVPKHEYLYNNININYTIAHSISIYLLSIIYYIFILLLTINNIHQIDFEYLSA